MITQSVAVQKIDNQSSVITILRRKEAHPEVIDLFEKSYRDDWFEYALSIAEQMPVRFWFSELRFRCKYGPNNPNMWGSFARKLRLNGYRMTGNHRPSLVDQRKGGVEWEWERMKHD